ncbi:MAG TPA: excinuclease ABC subunit UvrC [Stellaceae bacterium]|nr:excinuclease ABC subunit UvrC [Stellaceae bacterium]
MPEPAEDSALTRGVATIRTALRTLPPTPGVYRMLNAKGDALYVGKAQNLRNRVASYTHLANLSNRLLRMVAETHALEVVVTHTEVEALLLECNLIKRLRPRYNVLLRDDKSFPYIHITGVHDFPRLMKHRGARGEAGDYFGPFASAGAVNRTLIALQRAFLLRSCSDSMFASRSRPCLLFQIKRCSAPCVGRIDRDGYAKLVAEARAFLKGHSKDVQQELARRMQALADRLEFEGAGFLRDRIRALTQVQGRQDINVQHLGDADVIAAHQAGGQTSIQVFFFRGGQNWGNRAYFPSHDKQLGLDAVLAAFIGQFYDNKPPPPAVLTSHVPADRDLLAAALSSRAGHKVELVTPQRGDKRKLVEHALVNAREALGRRLAESSSQQKLLAGLAEAFGLKAPPQRIEVYDNSHIQGTNAVGAMIVAGPDGFIKNAYRKFNIRGAATSAAVPEGESAAARPARGDDYAMMREVLGRRFARALKEDPERANGTWPDLILVDGGAGQLSSVESALAALGIADVPVVAIAKGPDRDAGRERFFRPGLPPVSLEPKDPVLYFLQRLRDEAHRFAIGTHRARRAKGIGASPLDEIAGIGARRKRALLHHFGSARGVARAGLSDLERVAGISRTVAKKVYDHFHAEG